MYKYFIICVKKFSEIFVKYTQYKIALLFIISFYDYTKFRNYLKKQIPTRSHGFCLTTHNSFNADFSVNILNHSKIFYFQILITNIKINNNVRSTSDSKFLNCSLTSS